MESKLVSVIVPVYNVEKYINRCIDSLINQTYKNIQIILVDDGSPDECPRICDDFAKKDERINVIHKDNEGLGYARNSGIIASKGDYLFFVDSDDYVENNMIENCVISAEKYNSDIVLFGMNSVGINGEIIESLVPKTEKDVYCDEEITSFILPNLIARDPKTRKKMNLQMSAWGGMFSRSLIFNSEWRFVSEREYISEDFYSLLRLYKNVKTVSIVKMCFYNYCYNNSSLTHVFNSERYNKVTKCHQAMNVLCYELNYSREVMNALNSQYLGSVIMTLKSIVSSNGSFLQKYKLVKVIIKDEYFQSVIHSLNMKCEGSERILLIVLMRLKWVLSVYLLAYVKSK